MCCSWRSGVFEELECLVCKLARDKIIEGLTHERLISRIQRIEENHV